MSVCNCSLKYVCRGSREEDGCDYFEARDAGNGCRHCNGTVRECTNEYARRHQAALADAFG